MVLAELGEDERGLARPALLDRGAGRGDPDEAGDVVGLVLDPLAEDHAAVELGRGEGPDRRPRALRLAHHPHRGGGAADAPPFDSGQRLAQEAGALGERLGMGEDGLDPLELDLRAGDQVRAHREVVLADDRHRLGVEGKGVERAAHRALDRVLERDEGPLRLTALDGEDRVMDGRRPQRLDLVLGRCFLQRVFGERPGGAEVGDLHRHARHDWIRPRSLARLRL